jgi:hypothetical protein
MLAGFFCRLAYCGGLPATTLDLLFTDCWYQLKFLAALYVFLEPANTSASILRVINGVQSRKLLDCPFSSTILQKIGCYTKHYWVRKEQQTRVSGINIKTKAQRLVPEA